LFVRQHPRQTSETAAADIPEDFFFDEPSYQEFLQVVFDACFCIQFAAAGA
jgi:hypothetical protein